MTLTILFLHSAEQQMPMLAEGQTIADLYNERLPLYEKYADIRIDTEGNTLEETVAKIIEAVKEYEEGKEGTGFTG